MNIYLGKLEKEIQEEIKVNGHYATASEFVRDVVRKYFKEDRDQKLREFLAPAYLQAMKGEFSNKSLEEIFEIAKTKSRKK